MNEIFFDLDRFKDDPEQYVGQNFNKDLVQPKRDDYQNNYSLTYRDYQTHDGGIQTFFTYSQTKPRRMIPLPFGFQKNINIKFSDEECEKEMEQLSDASSEGIGIFDFAPMSFKRRDDNVMYEDEEEEGLLFSKNPFVDDLVQERVRNGQVKLKYQREVPREIYSNVELSPQQKRKFTPKKKMEKIVVVHEQVPKIKEEVRNEDEEKIDDPDYQFVEEEYDPEDYYIYKKKKEKEKVQPEEYVESSEDENDEEVKKEADGKIEIRPCRKKGGLFTDKFPRKLSSYPYRYKIKITTKKKVKNVKLKFMKSQQIGKPAKVSKKNFKYLKLNFSSCSNNMFNNKKKINVEENGGYSCIFLIHFKCTSSEMKALFRLECDITQKEGKTKLKSSPFLLYVRKSSEEHEHWKKYQEKVTPYKSKKRRRPLLVSRKKKRKTTK